MAIFSEFAFFALFASLPLCLSAAMLFAASTADAAPPSPPPSTPPSTQPPFYIAAPGLCSTDRIGWSQSWQPTLHFPLQVVCQDPANYWEPIVLPIPPPKNTQQIWDGGATLLTGGKRSPVKLQAAHGGRVKKGPVLTEALSERMLPQVRELGQGIGEVVEPARNGRR